MRNIQHRCNGFLIHSIAFTCTTTSPDKLSRILFVIHTFDSIIIKLLSAEIVSHLTELTSYSDFAQNAVSSRDSELIAMLDLDIERSQLYEKANIHGFVEEPLFSWYIDVCISNAYPEVANNDDIGEIPYGSATYTRVDSSLRQFLSIIQNDPSAARMIGNEENYDLFKTLLRLITQTSSLDSLKKSLAELQDENAQHLAMSLNIVKLQRVATLMADNLDNNSEEFWQTTVFKENQWVLAQIFACPCTIFSDKAYVGGKGVDNSGGNLCDFIYQNRLSQNVALIEIKTPCTEIIGNSYRGTYSFSHELSGAVNQVLNYRDNLTKSYYTLCHQSASQFEVLSPKCVVIIGKLASMNSTQIAAFESFRNSLSGVQILTFDELYQRVIDLIAILSETPSPTQHTPELEDVGKEFPF